MGVERYSVAAGLSEGGSLEQGGWGGRGGGCSALPPPGTSLTAKMNGKAPHKGWPKEWEKGNE